MIPILLIVLLFLMMIVGGDRGVKSFIAIVGNGFVLIALIYLITAGVNPILITVIGAIVFCQITLIYQNGHNLKTYSAIFSVIIVILILSIFIFIVGNKAKFGGYNEFELTSELPMYLSSNIDINMIQLMCCMVIIGLLGAIMDTAMAISSALFEVNNVNKNLNIKELINSGFNVGRDILGTTVNTLFFATIGESLMLIIVFIRYNYTIEQMFNSKAFFQEISMLIISNLGCLIIIPISVVLCSYMYKKDNVFIRRLQSFCDKHVE